MNIPDKNDLAFFHEALHPMHNFIQKLGIFLQVENAIYAQLSLIPHFPP
jgi:hypothetical protein